MRPSRVRIAASLSSSSPSPSLAPASCFLKTSDAILALVCRYLRLAEWAHVRNVSRRMSKLTELRHATPAHPIVDLSQLPHLWNHTAEHLENHHFKPLADSDLLYDAIASRVTDTPLMRSIHSLTIYAQWNELNGGLAPKETAMWYTLLLAGTRIQTVSLPNLNYTNNGPSTPFWDSILTSPIAVSLRQLSKFSHSDILSLTASHAATRIEYRHFFRDHAAP